MAQKDANNEGQRRKAFIEEALLRVETVATDAFVIKPVIHVVIQLLNVIADEHRWHLGDQGRLRWRLRVIVHGGRLSSYECNILYFPCSRNQDRALESLLSLRERIALCGYRPMGLECQRRCGFCYAPGFACQHAVNAYLNRQMITHMNWSAGWRIIPA